MRTFVKLRRDITGRCQNRLSFTGDSKLKESPLQASWQFSGRRKEGTPGYISSNKKIQHRLEIQAHIIHESQTSKLDVLAQTFPQALQSVEVLLSIPDVQATLFLIGSFFTSAVFAEGTLIQSIVLCRENMSRLAS